MLGRDNIRRRHRNRKNAHSPSVHLPQKRPSILDPHLETEPWIDKCPCADTLVLFVHNHPIAMIGGSSLESISLAMRLTQLRYRVPRKAS